MKPTPTPEMIDAFIIAKESADRRLYGFHNLGRHFILDGTTEVWFTASDDYEVGHAAMMAQLERLRMEAALSAALSVQPEAVVGEPVAWTTETNLIGAKHAPELALTMWGKQTGKEPVALYREPAAATSAPEGMRAALRLVAEYDDLLRHWEGPEQVLLAGDVEEIDAAYDKMVAACRAALSDAPAGCKDEPVRPFGWIDLPVGAKGAIVSELKKARSSFTISDFEIAENIVSALAALGGASHE